MATDDEVLLVNVPLGSEMRERVDNLIKAVGHFISARGERSDTVMTALAVMLVQTAIEERLPMVAFMTLLAQEWAMLGGAPPSLGDLFTAEPPPDEQN